MLVLFSKEYNILENKTNMKFACQGHRGCLILSLLATKA